MNYENMLSNNISDALYKEINRTTNHSPLSKKGQCVDKTFLVTGANGFIAYYLVLTILNANDKFKINNHVILLVRDRKKAEKRYGKLLSRNDITLVVQDVCMPLNDIKAADYIVHAASAADAEHFNTDPIGVFNANVIGAENIIDLIKRKNCKSMVYISSFTVYGEGTSTQKEIDESFCGTERWDNNRACYVYGKRSAEFLCMVAARQSECPIKIIRPGFVYGASSRKDTRVYSEIIRCVAEKQPIVLKSAGLLYRSMIYVTDLVEAILAVLFLGRNGEAYNVANEHASIRQFAETAVTAADSHSVFIQYSCADDQYVDIPSQILGAMSTGKIRTECDWNPSVRLQEGIAAAADILLSFPDDQ